MGSKHLLVDVGFDAPLFHILKSLERIEALLIVPNKQMAYPLIRPIDGAKATGED
jgi:hypothetical protein